VRHLTRDEAEVFAEMLLSGVPVAEAVPYFWDRSVTEAELVACETVVAAAGGRAGGDAADDGGEAVASRWTNPSASESR
jgi:hypothetical protein